MLAVVPLVVHHYDFANEFEHRADVLWVGEMHIIAEWKIFAEKFVLVAVSDQSLHAKFDAFLDDRGVLLALLGDVGVDLFEGLVKILGVINAVEHDHSEAEATVADRVDPEIVHRGEV